MSGQAPDSAWNRKLTAVSCLALAVSGFAESLRKGWNDIMTSRVLLVYLGALGLLVGACASDNSASDGTGGATANHTGGATGSGGTMGSGGATGTGGDTGYGGSTATGGAVGSGGQLGTGGDATATGGTGSGGHTGVGGRSGSNTGGAGTRGSYRRRGRARRAQRMALRPEEPAGSERRLWQTSDVYEHYKPCGPGRS